MDVKIRLLYELLIVMIIGISQMQQSCGVFLVCHIYMLIYFFCVDQLKWLLRLNALRITDEPTGSKAVRNVRYLFLSVTNLRLVLKGLEPKNTLF